MAKKIYEEEALELIDGTEVVIKPLPIKPLRKFMKRWNDMTTLGTDADDNDVIDIMFDCAVIVVETFNDVERDALEESLDMKTMQKILTIGGGIMTGEDGDPKAAAMA